MGGEPEEQSGEGYVNDVDYQFGVVVRAAGYGPEGEEVWEEARAPKHVSCRCCSISVKFVNSHSTLFPPISKELITAPGEEL